MRKRLRNRVNAAGEEEQVVRRGRMVPRQNRAERCAVQNVGGNRLLTVKLNTAACRLQSRRHEAHSHTEDVCAVVSVPKLEHEVIMKRRRLSWTPPLPQEVPEPTLIGLVPPYRGVLNQDLPPISLHNTGVGLRIEPCVAHI